MVRFGARCGLIGLLLLAGARGVDVVGLGGPPEERGPPTGGGRAPSGLLGSPALGGVGGGTDPGGSEREEIGGHRFDEVYAV